MMPGELIAQALVILAQRFDLDDEQGKELLRYLSVANAVPVCVVAERLIAKTTDSSPTRLLLAMAEDDDTPGPTAPLV